jgi:hypothetical protein
LIGLVLVAALAGFGVYFLYPRATPDPQYCWLAFGPDAQFRVLVRLDGDVVTFTSDHLGSTDANEERRYALAQCKDVVFTASETNTSYVLKRIETVGLNRPPGRSLVFQLDGQGPQQIMHQVGDLEPAAQPDGAPMLHFHGPLTIYSAPWTNEVRAVWPKADPDLVLQKGTLENDLYACVGTVDPVKGAWVVARSLDNAGKPYFPNEVRPVADVEYPPLRPGDSPLKRRYILGKLC